MEGLDCSCPSWCNSQIKTFTVTHFRSSHGSQEGRDSCLYSYTPTLHLFEKVILSELISGAARCNYFLEKHREKMKLFGLKAALFQVGKTTSSRSSAGKKGKELQRCNL